VGSIFRNAAAFGVQKIYLTGITGTPPRKEISKVALGAEHLVDWVNCSIEEAVNECRADGMAVFGLENTKNAKKLQDIDQHTDFALVLGNEVEGIDGDTLALLDDCLVIPMKEKKSLNVAVASGIAMFYFSV
jgi:23S rRNA (guanosine2251-2'-O)-methyltransferase